MEDERKRVTEAWGKIYNEHPKIYRKLSLPKVKRLKHQDFFKILARHVNLKDCMMLESGCGSGIYAFYLATIGNRVVALDYQLSPLSHLA